MDDKMKELRNQMKISDKPMWRYAVAIGISEMTLYRWLRTYDEKHYQKIKQAIESLDND